MGKVRLKDLWKKDYVKTAVVLLIIVAAIVGFWFGLKAGLRTEYPLLAVASGSMEPTLNVGDLIIVQGVSNISEIHVGMQDDPQPGDIIVFWRGGNLIVHRAINKTSTHITTKGDHNTGVDPDPVSINDVVGKVMGHIPWLGNISLFLHTPEGTLVIVLVLVVILASEFVLPLFWKRGDKSGETLEGEQTPDQSESKFIR